MESSKLRVNNTSGVSHISYNKQSKGWDVRFTENSVIAYLGTYPTIAEAKKALDAKKCLIPKKTTNTQQKYITYIKSNGYYYFQKKADGVKYFRAFKTLEEAVVARDNYLRVKSLTSQTQPSNTTAPATVAPATVAPATAAPPAAEKPKRAYTKRANTKTLIPAPPTNPIQNILCYQF